MRNPSARQTQASLAPLFDWSSEITLVPYSGIQMLDFGFRLDKVDLRPMKFIERTVAETADGQGGREVLRELRALAGDDQLDAEDLAGARPDDDDYSIRPVQALEPFLAKWVPVPVLRRRNERGPNGEERYDAGPTAWARMRVVELPEPDPDTGHSHRVQLAIDTTLVAENMAGNYVAPERSDAEKARDFRLVADARQLPRFLRRPQPDGQGGEIDPQKWVSDWLEDLFLGFKRASRPGRPVELKHQFEHWARYLAYLRLIDTAVKVPLMRFADTVSSRDRAAPVEVDLVLDVGNSRTCGILIERFGNESKVELARSFGLEIRDLSRPEFLNSGLMDSRVEFADLKFGDDRFASRSGRRNAFTWPSFVRIGPEALRLVAGDLGTETSSGLSSPKRYIWDDAPIRQDWRFHDHRDPNNLPKSVRAAMRHLNEAGDVLEQIQSEETRRLRPRGKSSRAPAIRPRFSRSALFGFMLAEIFAHALVQVNAPASRGRRPLSDMPRRLSRIILTLPTATSVQEQAIIRSRAEGALALVWAQLGMAEGDNAISSKPELVVEWDEASCTQLVYLYSELTQKFEGHIERFLQLKGTPRPQVPKGPATPSLRLACIDIGGGTTDLMVTTYWCEANRVLNPQQTFREGFRVAGDELMQGVIASIVLPRLKEQIEAQGGRYVAEKLRELFAGDLGGQDQRRVQKRRQFALRVLMPLAIALQKAAESAGDMERITISVADVLGLRVAADAADDGDEVLGPDDAAPETTGAPVGLPDELVSFIEDAARELGAPGFRLAQAQISCGRDEVDAIAREVFQRALGNMVEVIDHLGADVVLLTGRPSRLASVRGVIEEMLVVPPDRLVSMHSYRTGKWYPFRDPVTQRIGDPKSTVAVGGMLIALTEGHIANFKVSTEAFRMRSTARYIGEMDINGQIPDRNLLFSDVDLDRRKSQQDNTGALNMYTPLHIGARQLPLERWMTTPLYKLDYASPEVRKRRAPLRVTFERAEFDDDSDEVTADLALRRESVREAFIISTITDGEGDELRDSDLRLRLHTLGMDDEYWIDTGLFRF